MKERPLILFTLLIQLSVGAFLTLSGLYLLILDKAGMATANKLVSSGFLAIGPLVILGMLASLFHLGAPRNAYRALLNWRSSWLSREILFTLLFAFSGAIFSFLQWYQFGSSSIRILLGGFTSLFGVASVYSMARLYMLRTLSNWNVNNTLLSFFTTTFLLGSLAAGCILTFQALQTATSPELPPEHWHLLRTTLSNLAWVWFLLLGVLLISLVLGSAQSPKNFNSEAVRRQNRILLLRLALNFSGAGILGWLTYQQATTPAPESHLALLILAAFGLVLLGEILGRYLFYEIRPQPMAG